MSCLVQLVDAACKAPAPRGGGGRSTVWELLHYRVKAGMDRRDVAGNKFFERAMPSGCTAHYPPGS